VLFESNIYLYLVENRLFLVDVLLNGTKMTILSKKKVNQGKAEENSDSSAHHGGSHSRTLALGSMPNHSQVNLL
jgi:hypothetical protein